MIDASDRTLAITPAWSDVDALLESVERIGLQTPLQVAPGRGGQWRVVSGFRRLAAVRRLGWREVPCVRLEAAPDARLFDLQLWETLGSRTLSEVERARVVDRLTTLARISDEEIVSRYLIRLGGRADFQQLARYRAIGRLPAETLRAVDGGLSADVALLLAEWPDAESAFVLKLIRAAGAGRNRQLQLVELLRDLRKSRQEEAPAIWDRIEGPSAEALAEQPGLLSAGIERLRQRRYPRLTRQQQRLEQLTRDLQLPANARLDVPLYFEGDTITARVEAASADELRAAAAQLAGAGPQLEELFELL